MPRIAKTENQSTALNEKQKAIYEELNQCLDAEMLNYFIKFKKVNDKLGLDFKNSLQMLVYGYNTGVFEFELERVVIPRLPKADKETTEK